MAQLVKNQPAVRETWVRSLGWEDPLEKGKERLPTPVFWPGEFHGLYNPWGRKESDTTDLRAGPDWYRSIPHSLALADDWSGTAAGVVGSTQHCSSTRLGKVSSLQIKFYWHSCVQNMFQT